MSGESVRRRAGLGDLIDLAERMDLDGGLPLEELRERDRHIGRSLEGRKAKPYEQLLSWLDHVRGERRDLPGAALERALRLGNVLLFLAGLLLGWLAAAAVFYYDGSHPVNIINILAIFVGAQLLLLTLLILTLAPPRLRRLLPGSGALFETLDLIKPGRLAGMAVQRLPQKHRERALSLIGGGRSHGRIYGRVEKWAVTFSSQLFALSFNVGAVLGALHLVFFSDLAFSWSTTLKITAKDIHALTELLSAPWAAWLPAAGPSLALVESSRYFRLHEGLLPSGAGGPGDPGVLGEWWPFLVMAMLVYGLLPRLLLLAFSSLRLRNALSDAFIHYPGLPSILERMNGPLVDTKATEAEHAEAPLGTAAPMPEDSPVSGDPRICINWGEVPYREETLAGMLGARRCAPGMLAAGGGNTMDQDREAVRLAAAAEAGGAVLFVKSWEPPMEDLLDFLAELREALGRTTPVAVVLAGPPEKGGMGAVTKARAGIWSAKLRSLADPWISVLPTGEGSP